MRRLVALFVFAGLTAIGCNDRKTTPPAVVPVAHSMPSSRPTESPATPGESRPPTLTREQQKVLGKWERKTSGKEETLELKADGTAEWLERRDDGSMGRRAGVDDRPLTFRFKDDKTFELLLGGAGGWAVFTVFGVTDDEMEVEFVRRTLTYTRVK